MGEAGSDTAILCVDDEGIILMHLMMMLEKRYGRRYLLKGASSAEAGLLALERLYEAGVRGLILLTDWLMPGIKGDELLRIARGRYPDLKAIMLSGRIDEDGVAGLRDESLLAGFLSKPVAPEELYALIDSLALLPPPA